MDFLLSHIQLIANVQSILNFQLNIEAKIYVFCMIYVLISKSYWEPPVDGQWVHLEALVHARAVAEERG